MDGAQVQPDMWPLQRGETLSNHDWFPFYGHRFLASGFLASAIMDGRRADVGTAIILWSESMRQDPAGTLPECDIELASLARFTTVDRWLSVKAGVMRGWLPVLVEDGRTGEVSTRLGHPRFMQGIVEEMYKRKRGRDGAREAAALAQRRSRIRKKMTDLKVADHIIGDDQAVNALSDHFKLSDLYITAENVRAAMIEVLGYTGEVAQFPVRRGSRGP